VLLVARFTDVNCYSSVGQVVLPSRLLNTAHLALKLIFASSSRFPFDFYFFCRELKEHQNGLRDISYSVQTLTMLLNMKILNHAEMC
jgi:hypothetical protein